MKPITVRDLEWLLGPHPGPCLSLFMPTHRRRPDREQDPIRFRGLLARAAALLEPSAGASRARQMLEPLEKLADAPFWSSQLDGLAIYCNPNERAHFRLPLPVEELVLVGESFHVRPLIEALRNHTTYFVLSLAQKSVALYGGSPHALAPISVPGLPRGLEDALGEPERGRPRSLRGAGAEGSPLHSPGSGGEQRKEELIRYFRAVDRALWPVLHDSRAPLILAAVGYYHPLYREVNRYPGLLAEGLEGNFERTGADALHRRAWPLVARRFAEQEASLVEQYRRLAGTGRASEDLEEIARAAVAGRVRWLLTARGRKLWGKLDRETGALQARAERRDASDAEVLDELAEVVLLRGGEVVALDGERMPSASAAAALFRY